MRELSKWNSTVQQKLRENKKNRGKTKIIKFSSKWLTPVKISYVNPSSSKCWEKPFAFKALDLSRLLAKNWTWMTPQPKFCTKSQNLTGKPFVAKLVFPKFSLFSFRKIQKFLLFFTSWAVLEFNKKLLWTRRLSQFLIKWVGKSPFQKVCNLLNLLSFSI